MDSIRVGCGIGFVELYEDGKSVKFERSKR